MYKGHQEKADPWRNHHLVEQGAANSHTVVIGHGSQHENLSHNKSYESTQLGCTCIVKYGFFVTKKLTNILGAMTEELPKLMIAKCLRKKYMGI